MKIVSIACIFLLHMCVGNLGQAMNCSIDYKSHETEHAIFTIKLPSVTAKQPMVFFQLCFIPSFPVEIPDEFWRGNQSKCYIATKEDFIPKYTAIGRPIRLLDFPRTAAQVLLRHGNGIFEIEKFTYFQQRHILKIVVRRNVLLAGEYVCHIFEVKSKVSTSKAPKLSMDNTIISLTKENGVKVRKDVSYCYILPIQSEEAQGGIPRFADTEYVRFICDLCWFDKEEPKFRIESGNIKHDVPVRMQPEHSFRRYFGLFRVAGFPDRVRRAIISAGSAFLAFGESYRIQHMYFFVESAPTLPSVDIKVTLMTTSSATFHDGLKESYFEMIKKYESGVLNITLIATRKVGSSRIEKVVISCSSTGSPIPTVSWKIIRSSDNLEVDRLDSSKLVLHDPALHMDYDAICTSRNIIRKKLVRSKTIHLSIYHDGKKKKARRNTLFTFVSTITFNMFCFPLFLVWILLRNKIAKQIEFEQLECSDVTESLHSVEEVDDGYF